MWPESAESPAPLRTGLTTGTCATACCVAAAQALFADQQATSVSVTLPKGKMVDLPIIEYQAIDAGMKTSTIKDAGDDPDATHGATLFVELRLSPEQGVRFHAAQGVGIVTRTGLLLDVGEPAINPVPRKMMTEHLEGFAQTYHYQGGFDVSVGVINGEQIAQKTMNPRLGILGGLSILGTTGIVRPFSCAAYIASIHQGIDVARANGLTHIAATTGNASEDAIKSYYQLDDMALIEMGDFVGAVLKHIKKVEQANSTQLKKLSICGGFGKISKLAQHHMDLNSRASSIDLGALAKLAASLGACAELQERMKNANTSVEALSFAMSDGLPLADAICQQALDFARQYIPAHIALEVWAIDRKGQFVGKALDADNSKRGES
ncbi:cobalt-precorrin-5B (C(1))-methyltransferase [Marinomonas lutimaris]|uniref:cobalt-precorrin-5B (C(1))-methyltransferase n=1 Tax=Marinomonas lutimaris TaxID=2846746 RepID=UPI001CA52D51|nr:cobalt-precorrin-5B (C(1))-methyltransferase [Marinomonas lutimaris]